MGNKCERHYCNEAIPNRFNEDWLKSIPDTRMLSSLTIPGTHNSCSFYGGAIAQTQSWSIPLQLQAGIRYFDIRLRRNNDTLRLQHGIIDQKCTFDVILRNFREYLTNQPSEFIIMAVQHEYKPKNSSKSMETLFDEYTNDYQDLIILYKGKDIPIGDIRGRILFINVFHSRVNWTPLLKLQNEWVVNTPKQINNKNRKVKRLFNRAITLIDDGNIYMNYLSGVSDYGMVTPSSCASTVNQTVFKYKGRLGIVLCDFPGEALIQHLIDQNNDTSPINPSTETSELLNNGKLCLRNLNSFKYLSINENDKSFVCSKQKYYFNALSKAVNQENLIYDGDLLILKSDKLSETHVTVKKLNKNGNSIQEKKTLDRISNGDIITIRLITQHATNSLSEKTEVGKSTNYTYLSSDYSHKTKTIQKVIFNEREEENCEWVVELVK